MLRVTPVRHVDLDHRAYHCGSSTRFAAAASEEGRVSIATAKDGLVCRFEVRRVWSLRFAGPAQIALLTNDGLEIRDARSGRLERREPAGVGLWTSEGHAWTLRGSDDNIVCVTIVHVETERTVASQAIEDPFGQSILSLWPGSHPDQVAVWIGAQQDGQCNAIAAWDGSHLSLRRLDDSLSTGPPLLVDGGEAYVHVDDFDCVCRRATSTGEVLAHWEIPYDEDYGYYLELLDRGRVLLVGTSEHRAFLLEPQTLAFLDELEIAEVGSAGRFIGAVGEGTAVSCVGRYVKPIRTDPPVRPSGSWRGLSSRIGRWFRPRRRDRLARLPEIREALVFWKVPRLDD